MTVGEIFEPTIDGFTPGEVATDGANQGGANVFDVTKEDDVTIEDSFDITSSFNYKSSNVLSIIQKFNNFSKKLINSQIIRYESFEYKLFLFSLLPLVMKYEKLERKVTINI